MAVFRFTTTRLSGLEAAGRVQELQHAVIAPLLEHELGPAYGRLFADFEIESADMRSWYVDAETRPVRIGGLAPDRQAALRAKLAGMIARIEALAGTLEKESSQRAHLARVLAAAMTFPADDIWALGDEPLIVNWGFHPRDVPAGIPQAVLELIRRPKAVEEPLVTPVRMSEPKIAGDVPGTPERRDEPKVDGTAAAGPPRPPIEDPPKRPRVRWTWPTLPRLGPWPALPALGPWPALPVARLLWALFVVLALGCAWELIPSCTDWPILSSLKTCNSPSWLEEKNRRLQAAIAAEEARHRPCPAPVREQTGGDTPQGAVDAANRIPFSGTPDIVVTWRGHAELALALVCPDAPKSLVTGVGAEGCGTRIVAEGNSAGPPVDDPFDHATIASVPPEGMKVGVFIKAYNDVPAGTPVPFWVVVRHNGHNFKWRGGTLDRMNQLETTPVSQQDF